MKALSACEGVKKALRKGKNDILHARLGHIGETHSKKIILIVDNINGNLTKICFCELCISAKKTRNPSSKPMLEVTIKMGRVYMDLWGSFPNISLERNCYMWTTTD